MTSTSGRGADGERYDTHRNRAKLLSRTIPNSVTANVKTRGPVPIKNLSRIVFWGHGAPNDFCGFKPGEFAELLAEWRKLNPTLQTIDMPTCNVRHFDAPESDADNGRPYTEALKPHLKKKKLVGKKGLNIRTVPESAHGKKDMMSKLFWDEPTATWAYATGPTKIVKDEKTGRAGSAFAAAEFLLKPGPTKQAEYKQRDGFEEGLAWRAERAITDNEMPANTSFAYGKVDTLMDLLVPL